MPGLFYKTPPPPGYTASAITTFAQSIRRPFVFALISFNLDERNRYPVRRDKSAKVVFVFLLKRGVLLKERLCSLGEQILSFKNRPLLKRISVQESKKEDTKVVSLVKSEDISTKCIHHFNCQMMCVKCAGRMVNQCSP